MASQESNCKITLQKAGYPMEMRTKRFAIIPPCDVCKAKNDVVYNTPTIGGSWANLCENCLPAFGKATKELGTKMVKATEENRPLSDGKTKDQREAEFAANFDLEDVETLMDSVAPTACPEGCEVEPDGQCCHGYQSIHLLLGII